MCIYCGEREGLTYTSREHIFPATIGGIDTLPLGYVSDQANKYFSKLESNLVTSSFIGLDKSFWGPGKRGGEKPGRLPITVVAENDKEYLGYTFCGKPHQISQIIIMEDIKQIEITRDFYYGTQKELDKLLDKIQTFNGEYTYINSKLDSANFIVGLYENRLYIVAKDKEKINNFIEYIKEHIKTIDYSQERHSIINQPCNLINMRVTMDNDVRVFAKTALNVIAKIRGNEYIDNPCFNDFKTWIMGEKNPNFEQLPRNQRILPFNFGNNKTHYCILMNVGDLFVAFVVFYDYWAMAFQICKRFDNFFNYPYILFCDWKNKKEYMLQDLITLSIGE